MPRTEQLVEETHDSETTAERKRNAAELGKKISRKEANWVRNALMRCYTLLTLEGKRRDTGYEGHPMVFKEFSFSNGSDEAWWITCSLDMFGIQRNKNICYQRVRDDKDIERFSIHEDRHGNLTLKGIVTDQENSSRFSVFIGNIEDINMTRGQLTIAKKILQPLTLVQRPSSGSLLQSQVQTVLR